MELSILNAIQEIRTPILDIVMIFISSLGNKGYIWVSIAGILLCFEKTRKCGFAVLISVGLGFVLGDGILKPLFARPRPFQLESDMMLIIKRPGGYSFPSGHTLSAFAGACTLAACYPKCRIAAVSLAVLIGFSRLYLYTHYPIDVIAGAILGYFVAQIIIHILQIRHIHPKYCKSKSSPD